MRILLFFSIFLLAGCLLSKDSDDSQDWNFDASSPGGTHSDDTNKPDETDCADNEDNDDDDLIDCDDPDCDTDTACP